MILHFLILKWMFEVIVQTFGNLKMCLLNITTPPCIFSCLTPPNGEAACENIASDLGLGGGFR